MELIPKFILHNFISFMLLREAEIFSKYLVNEKVSAELLHRYESAVKKLNFKGNERDKKIISFATRYPSLIPCLDAGLAFAARKSLLRKKILIMFAILETTPEYYNQFTTKNFSRLKWIGIFFRGCWAVVKMIIGKIILIFI